MKKLVIIAIMFMAVDAGYKGGRIVSSAAPFDDFPPYQGTRQHPPFHELHQSFQAEPFKPQQYQSYHQRPFRREPSYRQPSAFRDQSLLREYPPFKNQAFYDDQSPYRGNANFRGQYTSFSDSTPYREQQYRNQAPFRNEQSYQEQPSFTDQYSYQQQEKSFSNDARSSSDSIQSYLDASYDKPIESYKEEEKTERQPFSFHDHSDYLKYGNHGLGYASVPSVSSSENVLPLSEEPSTTMAPSTIYTATHKPLLQSTVSSTTLTTTQDHTVISSISKVSSIESSEPTTKHVKPNTLADAPTTESTRVGSTVSSTTQTETKHPSNFNYTSITFTNESTLPVIVTESPVMSYEINTLPPIQFHTTKLSTAVTPASFYITDDLRKKIQQSVLNYFLSDESKSTHKANMPSSVLNYVLPEVSSNRVNSNIQGSVLNYLLPEEPKDALKSTVQSSLLDQLLQQGTKRGLSFQQFSIPEAVNYVPLATITERPKFTLPSIPIAALSAVSRPLQTINYLPAATLPRLSFMGTHSSDSTSVPLGTALSSGLSSNIQASLPTSISNSLPGGVASDISVGIPGSMSPAISTTIPTLNFGQSFQHVGQMRQFEAPRNQQYPSGLQFELGGFGGIDYGLQSSNSAAQPMELGIAKVGLSLPEMPRPHVPTFTKVSFGQQLW